MVSDEFSLASGASKKVGLTLIATTLYPDNVCGSAKLSLHEINGIADSAFLIYYNPLLVSLGSNDPEPYKADLNVYPVPAHEMLYLESKGQSLVNTGQFFVIDALGRKRTVALSQQAVRWALDISILEPGIYSIVYIGEKQLSARTFVKQ